jgi:DUF1680 family protein
VSDIPTPRTDAATWVLNDDELGSTRRVVDRDCARDLERELVTEKAQWSTALSMWEAKAKELERELAEEKSKLDQVLTDPNYEGGLQWVLRQRDEMLRKSVHLATELYQWREVAEELADYVQYESSPRFLDLRKRLKRFHKLEEESK